MCCCNTVEVYLSKIETSQSLSSFERSNSNALNKCYENSLSQSSTTQLFANHEDNKVPCERYLEEAVQLLIDGNPTDAIIKLEFGEKYYCGLSVEPEKRVEYYINYATAREQLHEWRQATQCLGKAVALLDASDFLRTDNQWDLLANLLLRISYLLELDNASSTELFHSWIKTARSFNELGRSDDADMCAWRAAYWLSKMCVQGETDDSLSEAADFIAKIPAGCLKAILLNGLGVILLSHGWHFKAASYFQQAYENLSPKRSSMKAIVLQNIGTAHAATNRIDLAISALTKALEMHRKRRDYKGIAETASNLGYAWAACGRWTRSRWNYVLAKQAAAKLNLSQITDQASQAIRFIDASRQMTIKNRTRLKFRSASVTCFDGTGDNTDNPAQGKRSKAHHHVIRSPLDQCRLVSMDRSTSPSIVSSENLHWKVTCPGEETAGD